MRPHSDPADPGRHSTVAVVSSTAAVVSLIGGWTYAASLQSGQFSSVRDSISALAARGTPHREVMTVALALTGVMHMVTAANVRGLAGPGRFLLALGGAFTVSVALAPLPSASEGSVAHYAVASASFGALAVWPWFARPARRQKTAAIVLCLLVASLPLSAVGGVFAGGGVFVGAFGLHERIVAGALVVWPWVAAIGRPELGSTGAGINPPRNSRPRDRNPPPSSHWPQPP